MGSGNDNSVLFSLKQLRNIDSQKKAAKEEAERSAAEAARIAQESAEQKRQAEILAKQRAEEERIRQEIAEAKLAERQEHVAHAAAKKRAIVAEELKVSQVQVSAEAEQAARHKARRLKRTIFGSIAITVLVAGGLIFGLMQLHQANVAEEARLRQKTEKLAELRAAYEKQKATLEAEATELQSAIAGLNTSLSTAATDGKRELILDQLEKMRAQRKRLRERQKKAADRNRKNMRKVRSSTGALDNLNL